MVHRKEPRSRDGGKMDDKQLVPICRPFANKSLIARDLNNAPRLLLCVKPSSMKRSRFGSAKSTTIGLGGFLRRLHHKHVRPCLAHLGSYSRNYS